MPHRPNPCAPLPPACMLGLAMALDLAAAMAVLAGIAMACLAMGARL